jgi:hypothetical protein
MSTIETLLRTLAADGQLNHVSLIVKMGRAGCEWECSYRDTKHSGSRFASDADPAEAMRKALIMKPERAKRSVPRVHNDAMLPDEDMDFG